LLLVAVFAIASRLAATRWTEDLQISYVIAFVGLAVGLALGQSRFRLPTVLILAGLYGVFVITWQIGVTLDEEIEWSERLLSLLGRLSVAITQFARQQPVQDPLLALLLFATLFWLLSLQAGYAITRHADPWQAVLPGGLALLVIHTYDYRPPGSQFTTLLWALSIYFVVSLLLVARLNYLKSRQQWQANRVYFSPEVDSDILQATFIATLVLVVLAWAAPLTPNVLPPARDLWAVATRPWNDIRSRFGNMFTSLQASFGVVNDTFGDQLSLGRGNNLSDEVVMEVNAPAQPPAGVRYYWRAWVYDNYDSGRWESTFTETATASPEGFDLILPDYQSRWTGVFSVTPMVPISTLYTPSHPVWVSRPIRAFVGTDEDGQVDIASVQAAVTIFGGETYRVNSSLSTATVTNLRAAGEDYPDWVTENYLGLPAVTNRTRELAEQIAAPYDNPYDLAEAVTNYLRSNITYAETIEAPPPNQEPIDWFLFDSKTGFCNYYATAEVVLLRSLGIPARMAVGYARGEAEVSDIGPGRPGDDELTTYTVLQRDAHAWPEVYFPGYGWVEFEPTVSQEPITRLLGGAAEGQAEPTVVAPTPTPFADDEPDSPADTQNTSSAQQSIPWQLILGITIPLAILLIAFAGWKISQRMNLPPLPVLMERSMRRVGLTPPAILLDWSRHASLPPVEKAYQEVNAALNRLGAAPGAGDTPTDRVRLLAKVMPEVATEVYLLLSDYHRVAYHAETGNDASAEQTGRLIRNLSWRKMISQQLSGTGNDTRRYAGY
jgi:transglutaminase-like putative cysteine protease